MIRTTAIPDIGTEGLRTLRDRLGPSGMLQFLQLIRPGSGDYTKERAELFDRLSVREIANEIAGEFSSIPRGDWRIELLDEARRVARLSEADQNTWLLQVRTMLAKHPNRDRIIEGIRGQMRMTRVADETRLRLTEAEEFLEADAFWRLEGLLNGSLKLPEDRSQAITVVAYIALVGHFLPHLQKRLQQPDAQGFLEEHFGRLLRQSTEPT